FAAAVVLAISLARARKLRRQEASDRKSPGALAEIPPVATRIAWLGLMAALVVVGTIALLPGITEAIVSRFESVVTFSTGGTVKTRIELWRSALFAFSQHPLLGVGPGSFRTLHEFLPTIHMQAMHVYVKGLSAHNLLLHYLAESGLVGALALVTLFVAQFRCGRWPWRHVGTVDHSGTDAALYVVSLLFLVTMMFEAGWLWGQFGYTFVFFAALIVRNREVAPS
ncbi:MAG TPA: O-antigen ligase family protein, partial [Candidatus Deferrimicrobium sp.]|nr:O-antigen ligase family protein [Candidatus Deferrimicrobium sp.]